MVTRWSRGQVGGSAFLLSQFGGVIFTLANRADINVITVRAADRILEQSPLRVPVSRTGAISCAYLARSANRRVLARPSRFSRARQLRRNSSRSVPCVCLTPQCARHPARDATVQTVAVSKVSRSAPRVSNTPESVSNTLWCPNPSPEIDPLAFQVPCER